ncbi:MAG: family 43 glycosylhydrolase [Clostridia bacterium]|nr:family 43 glycosylhydrolase [Clostridia bacterium]
MKSFYHGEINEFIEWRDTDGNIINASDGGIIFANGKYHWYGMALRPLPMASGPCGGQMTDIGVVMYESEDLLEWKYEGVILEVSHDPQSELYAPLRFERPKIIYNEKTEKYVLWCHFVKYPGNHGNGKGEAEVGLAVCNTVNGKYEWQGYTRPIDEKGFVRDMTVYKDFDGSAYLIYDRHIIDLVPDGESSRMKADRCLHVVKLSDDYLSFTDTYSRIESAAWREAPVVLFNNGYYYIITSGLTGWETNQAKAFRTKHLMAEWEEIGDPCVDDLTHTTFNTQGTNAFYVNGSNIQIVMLERHNTSDFEKCSYVWLPAKFTDNTVYLEYSKDWSIKNVI